MNLTNFEYYNNRELSWLEFNGRVLEEAHDKTNPLMERLKFLAITASNLDEFFMVRVSGLQELAETKNAKHDASGLTPEKQLKLIGRKVHEMSANQQNCLNRSIIPLLAKESITFPKYKKLTDVQLNAVERYYNSFVYPILTPMAIDGSRPFPLLNNRTLNIIITLIREDEDDHIALLQVPTVIPRCIELLPRTAEEQSAAVNDKFAAGRQYMLLEDLILQHIEGLFEGYEVESATIFRVTRDSDLPVDEEDAEDAKALLSEMQKNIRRRKFGVPVRLEIEKSVSTAEREFLMEKLELDEEDIYEISGPLDLTLWMSFANRPEFAHLRNIPWTPQPSPDFMACDDTFEVIRNKDVLVHHPYESFDCVTNFVQQAAADSQVLAIKQTLYRVSGNSPIVRSLMQAAENGKQVTVLVELKARFDEENNINWAQQLEKSGCHVVYGLAGLKVHCKICLVVRKEEDGIRRYIHLGTGNYNDSTARIYTDLSFFTCKETFGQDVSGLFNVITGYSTFSGWKRLLCAPVTLRGTLLRYIDNEAKNARDGKPARILAKLNSLVDVGIIQALYCASMDGVSIKLLVRGICCLKPGIAGLSDNITVVSIVDRYLEHSRIYYFESNGNPKIFLSSADWMPRNLDRRVEVAFPVETPELKKEIMDILQISMSDTVKLRAQRPDGVYDRVDRRGKEYFQSQAVFQERAKRRAEEFAKREAVIF
ncbi:MAG: RNA degradosome polyphosphate kinase [Clostridiales bacterium]|jgi:polyphosphate kinase|nr:RNA degradosome polyphosphate kinase [Clostridiales bacterium]